jgi:hypothetical protein
MAPRAAAPATAASTRTSGRKGSRARREQQGPDRRRDDHSEDRDGEGAPRQDLAPRNAHGEGGNHPAHAGQSESGKDHRNAAHLEGRLHEIGAKPQHGEANAGRREPERGHPRRHGSDPRKRLDGIEIPGQLSNQILRSTAAQRRSLPSTSRSAR